MNDKGLSRLPHLTPMSTIGYHQGLMNFRNCLSSQVTNVIQQVIKVLFNLFDIEIGQCKVQKGGGRDTVCRGRLSRKSIGGSVGWQGYGMIGASGFERTEEDENGGD